MHGVEFVGVGGAEVEGWEGESGELGGEVEDSGGFFLADGFEEDVGVCVSSCLEPLREEERRPVPVED